ncbi:MAG: hypothetical protein ABGY96_01330 [bacterium]|nr:hypothetical protein [Gammaproteobacteria bacterium]HIL99318.1 hypothetical protein [Pseudomonadales bacterium]
MSKAIAVRWETWDWLAVKSMFDKAMASAPGCANVLTQFATRYYRDTCQFDVAVNLLNRAIHLDPISAGPTTSLSYTLRYQGNFESALVEADRALAINPQHGYARLAKMLALVSLCDYAGAYDYLDKITSSLPEDDLMVMNCRGRLYASTGATEKSTRFLNRVKKLAKTSGGEMYAPLAGWITMIEGDFEQAITWMQIALDNRISQVLNVRAFAQILPNSPLRDADFQRFLTQLNLDDQSVSNLSRAVNNLSI